MHQFFSASIDLASAEVKGVCGWACVREREWEAGQGIIWVRAWANIAMTTPEGILCQKLESSAQGILKSCKFYLQNKPRHSGCKFYLLINKCTSPWLHKGGRSKCEGLSVSQSGCRWHRGGVSVWGGSGCTEAYQQGFMCRGSGTLQGLMAEVGWDSAEGSGFVGVSGGVWMWGLRFGS